MEVTIKKLLAEGGFLLIVVVIVAGVFVAISQLSTPAATAQEAAPGRVMVIAVEEVKNGERFGGEVRITSEHDDPRLGPGE